MSKVAIHAAEDLPWTKIGARVGANPPEWLGQGELDSSIVYHEPGGPETLQLLEVDYLPNVEVAVHAHDEDEIIYIVSGEMRFGTKTLRAGSSIFIKGGAFYGFTSGPNGLRFVNFRPRIDMSFHWKKGNG